MLVTFDQGSCGHPQVKPTSCLTNLSTVCHLQGSRAPLNHGSSLKEDLGDRMKQSAAWSSWAPGLKPGDSIVGATDPQRLWL